MNNQEEIRYTFFVPASSKGRLNDIYFCPSEIAHYYYQHVIQNHEDLSGCQLYANQNPLDEHIAEVLINNWMNEFIYSRGEQSNNVKKY